MYLKPVRLELTGFHAKIGFEKLMCIETRDIYQIAKSNLPIFGIMPNISGPDGTQYTFFNPDFCIETVSLGWWF